MEVNDSFPIPSLINLINHSVILLYSNSIILSFYQSFNHYQIKKGKREILPCQLVQKVFENII